MLRLTRVSLDASPVGLRSGQPELRTPRERCRIGRRRRLPLAGGRKRAWGWGRGSGWA